MKLQGICREGNFAEVNRYDDMMVGGVAVALGGTAPSLGTFGPSGGLQVYLFSGAGGPTQSVHFTIQLSHAYKVGTNLGLHVHWAPSTAAAGNVKWFIEYAWANIDAAFGAPSSDSTITAAAGVAWQHQVSAFTSIVGTGKGISSVLVGRLYRSSADGDDSYGASAALLGIDAHILMDSIGSRQEYIK